MTVGQSIILDVANYEYDSNIIQINNNTLTAIEVGNTTIYAYHNDKLISIINVNISKNQFIDAINFINENQLETKEVNLSVYGQAIYNYKGFELDSKALYYDLDIKSNYIPISNARPGIKREVKWIVIHDTGNTSKTANALNHEKYLFNNTSNYLSWHYTVDMDTVINHIPNNEVAYHASDSILGVGQGKYLGGGNLNGIGIEMAINEGNDLILSYHRLAKLTAYLLDINNLDITKVKYHRDFANKVCPKTLINNNLDDYFFELIKYELKYIEISKKYQIIKQDNNYLITNEYLEQITYSI